MSQARCPRCGFSYAWNGAACKHCHFPESAQPLKSRRRRLPGLSMMTQKLLIAATFPVWAPLALIGGAAYLWLMSADLNKGDRLRRESDRRIQDCVSKCNQGTVKEAWARSCTAMERDRMVGYSTGFGMDLGDELVSALARAYPKEQAFFINQLSHPNPVFAGYAAVYLGRAGGVGPADLPVEVISRSEIVRVQLSHKEAGNRGSRVVHR